MLFSGEKEEEEKEEERHELGLNAGGGAALSSSPLFFVRLVFLWFFSLTAELRMAISIPAADGPAVDVVPDFPLFFSPLFFSVSPRSSEAEFVADCPPSVTSGTV